MSKKTRKKSSKPAAPKAAPKAARAVPVKSAKKTPATTRPKKASTPAKPAAKKPSSAAAKASHTAPSKPLKKTIPPATRNSALAEGAKAPAFQLPRDGGATVTLSDFKGKNLVLFFYPRADTPGCTKEAIDFTRLSSAFADLKTVVLGVSADPQKAQESFRDKHQLATPLISDETHEMLEAYGAWGEKSMYGKTFLGVVRSTVLIGHDGKVLKIWRHVKVDGHADEVLAAVQAL